jgi:hypothetical protein
MYNIVTTFAKTVLAEQLLLGKMVQIFYKLIAVPLTIISTLLTFPNASVNFC